MSEAFSLLPASAVVVPRDEADALAYLRASGLEADEQQLLQLARQLAEGEILLVRSEAPADELDELDELDRAVPRLRDLTVAS